MQVKNILVQMANSMNCPPAHMQDLYNSLTQGSRLQGANADVHGPTVSNSMPHLARAMASQPMTSQPSVTSSMGQWPGVNDAGNHLLASQPTSHSMGQSLHQPHQPHLPPHLQPFTNELSRHQSHSMGGGSDSLGNFGGFGSGNLGSLNGGSLSRAPGSAGFGSGNLGGSLSDALGRGPNFSHTGGFNDNLQCIDLGLGQM